MPDNNRFKTFLTAWDLKKNEAADVLFTGIDEEAFPTLFPENIMQMPDEIAKLVLASRESFENIAIFSAEQELFYEAITSAMVFAKWNQLENLQEPILELYNRARLSESFTPFQEKLAAERERIREAVKQFLDHGILPQSNADEMQQHYQHISARLEQLDIKTIPEKFRSALQTEKDDIIANYITAKIYNSYQQKAVADYLAPFLEQSFAAGELERAPLYASDAPEVAHFILTGPPAVGKSSSLQQMKDLCEEKGCNWDNMLKMSGDERRDFFISIYEDMHHAIMDPLQVASDGRIIKRKIAQTLNWLLEQGKSRPIYHDEATAIKAMVFVNLAIQGNTPLYVVQKDLQPEISIARSFKRYMETKRPNATSEIYRKHRDFPAVINKFLHAVDGHNVHYELVDAEVPLGKPAPLTMQIDAMNGVCRIFDTQKAFAFHHKANISNIDAKPSPECNDWEALMADITKKLYPAGKTDPLTSMGWLDTFCERYQVDFMDAETKRPVFSIQEKGKRVIVRDKTLFSQKMQEDAAFRRVMNVKFPSVVRVQQQTDNAAIRR